MSAKTGANVEEAFLKISEKILDDYLLKKKEKHLDEGRRLTNQTIKPEFQKNKKKGCC